MRAVIVYFSLTGNTQKVASKITELLNEKNIGTTEIRLRGGEGACLGNILRALFRSRAKTEKEQWDLSEFDFVLLGSPVWTFSPAPAVNTFLNKCSGLEGKNASIFVTYGSGAGKKRALRIMKKQLLEKGTKDVFSFSISDRIIKRDKSMDKKIRFFLDSSPYHLKPSNVTEASPVA